MNEVNLIDVRLIADIGTALHYSALVQPGLVEQVTVVRGERLNRRETQYEVTVRQEKSWKVLLLAMPNGNYAWRIPDHHHREAGEGDYHANEVLAFQDGVIPYILTQEL